MDNIYESLGFKKPEYLINHCGIKIYIGTKGKDDWDVEIPRERLKAVKGMDYHKEIIFYGITESQALELAKTYTT